MPGRRRHRRGTAELETALVIPILLGILFLVAYLLTRGRSELTNAYNSENNVYGQVVAGKGTTAANDPTPAIGVNMPLLPTRLDYSAPTAIVTSTAFGQVVSNRTDAKAVFLDSAWAYSSWPNTSDQSQIQAWFEAYVGESHPANLVNSLGLRPPGPP
jgi:hypothetical protein